VWYIGQSVFARIKGELAKCIKLLRVTEKIVSLG